MHGYKLALHDNWLFLCYVIGDFKGPEVRNVDNQYFKGEKIYQTQP